ncbi:MAG: hypothetical protein PHR16_13860 [Methylovulum sp.]|nr:hypothetical protein [Methylovulum sp.]
MNEFPEFAEEYTPIERARIFVTGLISGCLVVAVSKLYFFPWLNVFANSAHCRTVFGFDGLTVLWYGLFVGIPFSCVLLVGSAIGYRGYKILRDHQTPPNGEKVMRPTRIIRGSKAKIAGYLHLMAFFPFFVISIWGGFQASAMSKQAQIKNRNGSCPQTSNLTWRSIGARL